jgi:hypothetical protein
MKTLNNPDRAYPERTERRRAERRFTPQSHGYTTEDVGREYTAETIRAYLTDPHVLKSVAPTAPQRSARRSIRIRIIPFNALAAMAGIDPGGSPIPKPSDPDL